MQSTTPKSRSGQLATIQPAAKTLSQMSDDELRELGARAWAQCFGKKSSRALLEFLAEKPTKPAPKGGAS